MGTILVRYGEIALKSRPVRLRFERTLMRNIEDLFLHEKEECLVSREWGRILLFAKNDEKAGRILRRVFGITSFSPARECTSEPAVISQLVAERSREVIGKGQSFAIRARRSGQHPYSSQELAARVGAAVLEENAGKGIRVDLTDPDKELFIEVRQKKAYVFLERFPGPGGLPMGTQGRVAALLEDGKSAAAAWMMMKRGCRVIAVSGEQGKGTGEQGNGGAGERGGGGARTALEILLMWVPGLKSYVLEDCSMDGLAKFAKRRRAEAIILGSTYTELEKGIPKAAIPVLFPLCGMSDGEIAALIDRIRRAGP